jgi:hypothetical protein
VDVERLGGAEPVLVPHARHEVLARHDRAGVGDELRQEVELLARERQLRPLERRAARPGIDAERADGDRRGPGRVARARRGRAARAAQEGPQARNHLAARERLHDVVVGAELESDDAVGLRAAGREHDDRHLRPAAQLAAEVAPVAVGKGDVQQHDVGLRLGEADERVGHGVGDHRLESLARERARERLGDRALVLHEQDARTGVGGHVA